MSGVAGFKDIGFPGRGTDADAVMKLLYAKKHNLFAKMYKGSNTFRTIPKDSGGQGKAMDQPFFVTTGGAVSHDFKAAFNLAVNQSTGPGFTAAKFGWDNMYAHWAMDVKQKKQMPGRGKGSYIGSLRQTMERTKERMERLRLAHIFGDGSGTLGRVGTAAVGSSLGAITFYLENITQVIYFERDIQFQVGTTSTATSVVKQGSKDLIFKVTEIDRKARKVVCKVVDDDGTDTTSGVTAAQAVAALAKNRYLFGKGDVVLIPTVGPDGLPNYGGTRVMPGFAAWCPETLAANDNFFGVNRNQDRNRLAGVVHEVDTTDTEREYQNTLISASYVQETLGGRISNVVMNPLHYRDFTVELGKSAEFKKMDVSGYNKGVPGFKVLRVATDKGEMMVHTDIHCPPGVAWGYVPSDWKICSLDQFIHVWNEDGRIVDRIQSENKVGGAIQSYATMICRNPLNLARIKLPAIRNV